MKEYIERDAAMESIIGLTIVDPAVAQYANAVYYNLQNLPVADVLDVRHGRWEKHPQSNEDDPVYTCSLCKLNVSGFEKRWIKYCPNCGALMQEEDNGEK